METIQVEVCIYGGTSGGVIAAVAAAREGQSVVLIEPGRHLGGLTSGGLGFTDYGDKNSIGGLSMEFYRRVEAHYQAQKFPANDGPAGPDFYQGQAWAHEPHVAEAIFDAWIKAAGVRVVREHRIAQIEKTGAKIRAATFDFAPPDNRGAFAATPTQENAVKVEAAMWIDASYEGDLLARAGVSYTTKRESRAQYGEDLNGVHLSNSLGISAYRTPDHPESGLLPFTRPASQIGKEGDESAAVQAYTFRLCLVQNRGDNAGNWREIEPIGAYDPLWFEHLGRRLTHTKLREGLSPKRAFYHYPGPYEEPRLVKISPLPRGKTDANQMDFVGGNHAYPEGNWKLRGQIWRAHEDFERGFLFWLRTDSRVPDDVRAEIATWGLPKDEFKDTGGWPHALYVRESRRMIGQYVMTQRDCQQKTPFEDSIGMGSYSLDSHFCDRVEIGGELTFEGGFYEKSRGAYPIPYRALAPKANECENLLVLFCLSSTHAAYSSLRMEPVLMILGESAAIAAHLALQTNSSVQNLDSKRLTQRLREVGQILEL